jgi:molybdopterin synthase sulfur carrier subunit
MPEPASTEAAVRVRLFAALREAAGWSERLVALPAGAPGPCTPQRLWQQLGLTSHWPHAPSSPQPRGGALPAGLRVAINQHFATPDTPLAPGDELAFLPPITGG